jgi:UDP-N-acetylmuramoyl-tripeptide--D-alanyl-D-alanine ligase
MSARFTTRDATRWTGGQLMRGALEAHFEGVSIDTRALGSNELFVAIVGPTHDAHRFLAEAVAGGAAGLVIERGRPLPAELGPDLPTIAVDDTTRALGALAAGHRRGLRGPLVAITGSNGKTTTKEMCASILSVSAPCLKSEGNLTNQFGLPLTLLRRSDSDRAAVVELGTNHCGEIAALAAIALPTVGVITNVGTAHIEYLGNRDRIAREKGDLLVQLPAEGAAVLNADDPRVVAQAERTCARIVRFGLGPDAEVRAERVEAQGARGFRFQLAAPQGRVGAEVRGLGEATLANALAAAAAALAAGASLSDVAEGLARHRPVQSRLQQRDLPGDAVLLDDSYNANPQSMEAALRILVQAKGSGRGLAVLGEMAELGELSEPAHAEVGRLVAALGIDLLFALGAHARDLTAAAIEAGMAPDRVCVGEDCAELGARVKALLQAGDWVLVKGSRSARMERVAEALGAEGKR